MSVFRLYVRSVLVMLSILLMAACTAEQADDGRTRPYPDDGYLGITRANPNLQSNPTHYTYKKDFQLARKTLAQIPGVNNAVIFLNSDTLHVRLQLSKQLDPQEVSQIEQEATNRLQDMFPRYDIHLISRNRS